MKEWKENPKKFDFKKIKETSIDEIPLPTILNPKFDGELCFLYYENGEWRTINKWGHVRTDFRVTHEVDSNPKFDKSKTYIGELHCGENLYEFLRNKSNGDTLRLALFDVIESPNSNPSYRKKNYRKRLDDIGFLPSNLTMTINNFVFKVSSSKIETKKDLTEMFGIWTKQFRFEGIVCRSPSGFGIWKVKTLRTVDLVVMGIAKKGKHYPKQEVGSLLLGLYYKKKLLKIGKVGSGFKQNERVALWKALLLGKTSEDKHYIYVKPKIVVQITFHQLVPSDEYDIHVTFREPRFDRFRPDKPSFDCELKHQLPEACKVHIVKEVLAEKEAKKNEQIN